MLRVAQLHQCSILSVDQPSKQVQGKEVFYHIRITLCLLDHLGLVLNTGKSTLVPTQKIRLIGVLILYKFESVSADQPFPDNLPPLSQSVVLTFHNSLHMPEALRPHVHLYTGG